jgi:hypothetical protein
MECQYTDDHRGCQMQEYGQTEVVNEWNIETSTTNLSTDLRTIVSCV